MTQPAGRVSRVSKPREARVGWGRDALKIAQVLSGRVRRSQILMGRVGSDWLGSP